MGVCRITKPIIANQEPAVSLLLWVIVFDHLETLRVHPLSFEYGAQRFHEFDLDIISIGDASVFLNLCLVVLSPRNQDIECIAHHTRCVSHSLTRFAKISADDILRGVNPECIFLEFRVDHRAFNKDTE